MGGHTLASHTELTPAKVWAKPSKECVRLTFEQEELSQPKVTAAPLPNMAGTDWDTVLVCAS